MDEYSSMMNDVAGDVASQMQEIMIEREDVLLRYIEHCEALMSEVVEYAGCSKLDKTIEDIRKLPLTKPDATQYNENIDTQTCWDCRAHCRYSGSRLSNKCMSYLQRK